MHRPAVVTTPPGIQLVAKTVGEPMRPANRAILGERSTRGRCCARWKLVAPKRGVLLFPLQSKRCPHPHGQSLDVCASDGLQLRSAQRFRHINTSR